MAILTKGTDYSRRLRSLGRKSTPTANEDNLPRKAFAAASEDRENGSQNQRLWQFIGGRTAQESRRNGRDGGLHSTWPDCTL